MFGMMILSEIDPIEDLVFMVDLTVCLVSVVIIVILAACDHRVLVTPPIEILPLFEGNFL